MKKISEFLKNTKKVAIIILATFLCSCGTGLSIRKSDVKYFDKHFSGTFDNNAFKINGRRYGSPTLLDLFEIHNVSADSIAVKINDTGQLQLTYKDKEVITKTFEGSFKDKGYYEVFLRNEKKEIPPGFPIIYGKHNVNRIRVALTVQDDLIIDNKWNESANIFVFGVGDKGRRQSYFRKKAK